MKNSFYFLFFLLAATLTSCYDGDWHVYQGSEFSVEFPGITHDTVTVENGIAGAKTYFQPVEGALDSNLYYAVSMYSLPDSVSLVGAELNRLFYTDVQIYAWSIGGVLPDSGKVVKSGDVEGREYKVVLNGNNGVATIRKFAIGKHLYTLLVVTQNMRLENKGIRRFMDSFKLKKTVEKHS